MILVTPLIAMAVALWVDQRLPRLSLGKMEFKVHYGKAISEMICTDMADSYTTVSSVWRLKFADGGRGIFTVMVGWYTPEEPPSSVGPGPAGALVREAALKKEMVIEISPYEQESDMQVFAMGKTAGPPFLNQEEMLELVAAFRDEVSSLSGVVPRLSSP